MSVARTRTILAATSLLACLGLAETVGRSIRPENPQRADGFVSDTRLGWVLPAGQTMQWRGKPANINRLGMRGAEPKSNPTARILMVGDSSMFGDGVKDHETMAAQLGQLLPTVDVQNAGVPGYTCTQSREWISRLVTNYQPDILISYNQHSDFRKTESHDQVVAASSLGLLADTGIGHLLTLGILWRRIQTGRSNLSLREYTDCLTDMAETQQDHNGHVLYVIPFSADDFPSSPVYGLPEPEPEGQRLADYRQAMCQVAEATGNACLSGPETVRSAGLTNGNSLQDMVHPTALGHQALARGIARTLESKAWVGRASKSR